MSCSKQQHAAFLLYGSMSVLPVQDVQGQTERKLASGLRHVAVKVVPSHTYVTCMYKLSFSYFQL